MTSSASVFNRTRRKLLFAIRIRIVSNVCFPACFPSDAIILCIVMPPKLNTRSFVIWKWFRLRSIVRLPSIAEMIRQESANMVCEKGKTLGGIGDEAPPVIKS